MRHRLTALTAALALLLPLQVAAESTAGSATAADTAPTEAAPKGPLELTRSAADRVLGEIRNNRAKYESDTAALITLVDGLVDQLFDFQTMSLLVLGPHWKSASEEQRSRFVEGFKNLLIKTYSKALLQAGDEPIQWEPLDLAPGDTRTIVNAKAQTSAGPIAMSWRLRQTGDSWRVYDVVVDGISLVTNYRGSYSAEIRKVGLDGLIQKLEQHAAG